MALDPGLERAIRTRLDSSDFARWMGNRIGAMGEGTCEMTLEVEPHHLNPGGIVHGGVIASLIDSAIGLALRTKLDPASKHVTLTLDVQYLAMARTGTLTARGVAVHTGRRTALGEATMTDDAGRVIAKGTANFVIVSGPPADEADLSR